MDLFNRFKSMGSDFDKYKSDFENQYNDLKRMKRRCGRSSIIGRGKPQAREHRRNPFASMSLQSYDEIRKACSETGSLFEDPEYEAVDSNVFFSMSSRQFEWLRPSVSTISVPVCLSGLSASLPA